MFIYFCDILNASMNPTTKEKAYDKYSDKEKEYYKQLMRELTDARTLLRTSLPEFDDKTYLTAYEENRKADLAYNPKLDDENDIAQVTTGLTREKGTTVLSTITNLNLQPNITAFEKDNSIIAQLGGEMEDLVKKSREIEVYNEKRQDIYRELIAQGEVYVEEMYTEKKIVAKYDTSWSPKMKIADFKGDDKPIYDVEAKCEVKLHLGKYVLTSSMNEKELQNNDLFATYEEVDRGVAQSIYGEWDRWELVPEEVQNENPFTDAVIGQSGADYSWNTYKVAKGKVGITKIYKRFENKYMVLLNGVMVLPIDFPLTKISPSGLIPVGKGIGEGIPNFRMGKGMPSKTKVDQKLYDTILRAMVGKAWQSFKPALGNKSGNVLSRDVVKSNTMTTGLKQGDIFPILPTQLLALSNSDISMFNIVKEVINEKTVTDSYSGQNTEANTATEVMNQQKQTMLKLSAFVDGVRSLERRLIYLRIFNIIANWTKAEESYLSEEVTEIIDGVEQVTKRLKPTKSYKKYSVATTIDGGQKGLKISQFHGETDPLPTVREQIDAEEKMSEENGKAVRLSFLNADWLRHLEAIWNVEVIASPETDDNMQLLLFIDNLTRVANMFGVQVLKQDYVLQRIAIKMGEDYDKLFQVPDQQLMNAMQQNLGTQVDNPAQQAVNSKTPSPLTVSKTR